MKITVKGLGLALAAMLAGCGMDRLSAPPAQVAAAKQAEAVGEGVLILVLPEKMPESANAGVLRIQDGVALAPQDTQIKAQVFGPVAQVTLTQTFQNTTGKTVDADWLLPIPQQAVVMDLTVNIGERHFRAVMADEAQAQKLYALAIAQGRHAAMVRAQEAGWRLHLGQVMAGERVEAGVVYGEVLRNVVQKMQIPSRGHCSVKVAYDKRFELPERCFEGNGLSARYYPEVEGTTSALVAFMVKFPSHVINGKETIETTMDGNGVIYMFKHPIDEWEQWDKVDAEAYAKAERMLDFQKVVDMLAGDRQSGRPDHAAEILALARKHKIIVPGLSLLMIDAKK